MEHKVSWRLAQALEQLRREVNAAHPGRPTGSDGTIGDAKHRSRVSAHNPNDVGVVRAWDVTAPVGHDLAEWLRLKRDPRIYILISKSRICSAYNHSAGPAWEWRPYGGANPHDGHAHIQVDDSSHLYDDDSPWGYSPEEDDVIRRGNKTKSADVVYLQEQVNRVLTGRHDTGPLTYPCDGLYGSGTAAAVADAKAKVVWADTNGDEASAAFLTRCVHWVGYYDLQRHMVAHNSDDHDHDGVYAPIEHGHSGVVTVK